jgi:hypothetical protein
MNDQLPARREPRGGLPNLDRHLEPERSVKQHGEAVSRTASLLRNTEILLYDIRRSSRGRDQVRQDLATLPQSEVLRELSDDLKAALALAPDRRVIQASVAVLFDSRVRGPQNPQIYLEALTYDLADEGFPPAVVVAACQSLRREGTFTPEIAEVLAACRKKLASYRAVAHLANWMSDVRKEIEDAIAAADAEPPPAPRPPPEPFDWNAEPGDAGWD